MVRNAGAGAGRPLVSILIPAYNAAKWICAAVASALEQQYPATEIIVADDGSTDGTLEQVRAFSGRITCIAAEHRGGNAARNLLLRSAAGDWVQFLDADDYLRPDKILGQMEHALDRAPVDVVYSPVIVRQESTGVESPLQIDAQADPALHYIQWAAFCTSGLLFRRTAIIEAGGWKESQPVCQEHELLLRILRQGKTLSFHNSAATVYRDHGVGTVSRKDPMRTVRARMELTDQIEAFLNAERRLTPAHRRALFTARMESARTAWKFDRAFAQTLAGKAAAGGGRHWVASSPALPPHYQLLLWSLGFAAAERCADLQRRVTAY